MHPESGKTTKRKVIAMPGSSLLTLPTETLFEIISHLGTSHLKQLSLTHRSLHTLIPPYL
ncbi:10433_t:CDS:1, partial [Acaulospora morrowiae]